MFIPAWSISLLTLVIAVLDARRFIKERNLVLIGKVIAWTFVTAIYAYIAFQCPPVLIARELSRAGWLIVTSTEISYRLSKNVWKL